MSLWAMLVEYGLPAPSGPGQEQKNKEAAASARVEYAQEDTKRVPLLTAQH